MKIRYQPRFGNHWMLLAGIKGGHPLASWHAGEEREIPPDLKVPFSEGGALPTPTDAATAIFRHGPDFVDVATGENPLYQCADCGQHTEEECWFDQFTLDEIPFVNEKGERLCTPCWISYHPERIVEFRQRAGRDGAMVAHVDKAREIIAKRSAAQSAAPSKPIVDSAAGAAQGV